LFNVGTTNQFNINSSGNVVTSGALAVNNTVTVTSSSTAALLIQNGSTAVLNVDASTTTITIGSVSSGNYFTLSAGGGFQAFGTAQHGKTISLPAEYAGAVLDAQSDASCLSSNSGT